MSQPEDMDAPLNNTNGVDGVTPPDDILGVGGAGAGGAGLVFQVLGQVVWSTRVLFTAARVSVLNLS